MTMRIRGSTTITWRDQIDWLRGKHSKRSYVAVVAAYAIILVFLMDATHLFQAMALWAKFLAAIVLAFIVAPLTLILGVAAPVARLDETRRMISWEIDDVEIRMTDGAGTRLAFPWGQVKSFNVTSKGLRLDFRPSGSRWIPARAFSPDAFRGVVGIAQSNVGEPL